MEKTETRTYCITSRQQSLNTRWVICYLKDSAVQVKNQDKTELEIQ